MHRDTKLGLALGMLVIGFATAFCFPRESPSDISSSPVAVSPELQFIPIRAYPSEAVSHPVEEVVTDAPSLTDSASLVAPTPSAEVFPLEAASDTPPTAAPAVPDPAPGLVAAANSNAPRTYRVEAGDTLSGIAFRYLGSSAKYYDLFAANQDQLSTPDALKVGMVLRLPVEGEGAESSALNLAGTAPEPLPTLAIPERHTVKAGETLEGISRLYFGDASLVPQLRAANPHLSDPQHLSVGSVIELPAVR